LQADIPPEVVLSIINGLPTGYRTVFNLYVFEKYNHHQIAIELGISESTSKSQLLRARRLIQQRIVEWMNEKEKKEEKKKVIMYSIFLCMNDDLDYIDKIVFEKLNNFSLPVVSNPTVFINSSLSVTQVGPSSAIKAFLITTSGKIAIIAVSLITGALALWLYYGKLDKTTPQTHLKSNQLPATLVADSINQTETPKSSNVLVDTNVKTHVDTTSQANKLNAVSLKKTQPKVEKKITHDTVQVKKVIKVKKKRIVTRTIKKTDTLPQ
jgi:hypothetical protein